MFFHSLTSTETIWRTSGASDFFQKSLFNSKATFVRFSTFESTGRAANLRSGSAAAKISAARPLVRTRCNKTTCSRTSSCTHFGANGAAATTSAADAAASAMAFSSRRRALESAAAEATDKASINVSTTLARPFSETFFTERSLKVKSSTCEKNADKDLACLSTGLVQSRVGPPPKILLVDFSAESVPNEFMLGRGQPQSRSCKGAVDKDL
mmetsp:Transcript_45240/g.114806  ORF Transcript_45240/g.114806 Transcript_45240/m.114806 type:complete len:211 (-) Transcript_45240:18-650(-)